MIPLIVTPYGSIPTFPIFVTMGVLAFIFTLHLCLKNAQNRSKEEEFIIFRLLISAICAWLFAAIFDAFFKYLEYGIFEFKGITFYGGLIGAVISICVLLINTKKNGKTQFSCREWLDKLTLPLLSFHFFGRLGCFFGGCCYGKVTDSPIGVVFPDNIDAEIIHGGVKRYPTQLFEALLILVIFLILLFIKNRASIYLLMYSVGRFIIEFFRGDDRGFLSSLLSPAQVISVVLFGVSVLLLVKLARDCRNLKTEK